VVFTLPAEIAEVAFANPRRLYDLLFAAASQTLLEVAADPKHLGAKIGFSAVLHTWGQTLMHHPHLHCIVPGGGLSEDGSRWVSCPRGFFLPVKVLSRVFRGKFLAGLKRLHQRGELFLPEDAAWSTPAGFDRLINRAYGQDWLVYAKPPTGGAEQTLKYLARYTHRVAIANSRLVAMDDEQVTFRWKDYAHGGRERTMTLAGEEFLRRFLIHVLPKGLVRLRSYGLLANRHRREQLARCRRLLGVAALANRAAAPDDRDLPPACPACGAREWRMLESFPRPAPEHARPAPRATARGQLMTSTPFPPSPPLLRSRCAPPARKYRRRRFCGPPAAHFTRANSPPRGPFLLASASAVPLQSPSGRPARMETP
jgi:hypothetical protein